MHSLKGRFNDFITLPDGRKLSPWFFWNSIDLTGVAQFRIVQEKIDVIRVLLKVAENYEVEQMEKTIKELRKVFGGQVNVVVNIVDKLPRDTSGKMRSVISKIQN
jgi:phenylacetate-CoA ligase